MRLPFTQLQISIHPFGLARDFLIFLAIAHIWDWFLEDDPAGAMAAFDEMLDYVPFTESLFVEFLLLALVGSPFWFLPLFIAALLVREGRILHLALLTPVFWGWMCLVIVGESLQPIVAILFLFYFTFFGMLAWFTAQSILGRNSKFPKTTDD